MKPIIIQYREWMQLEREIQLFGAFDDPTIDARYPSEASSGGYLRDRYSRQIRGIEILTGASREEVINYKYDISSSGERGCGEWQRLITKAKIPSSRDLISNDSRVIFNHGVLSAFFMYELFPGRGDYKIVRPSSTVQMLIEHDRIIDAINKG